MAVKKRVFLKNISLYDLEGGLEKAILSLQADLQSYSPSYKDLKIEVDIECHRTYDGSDGGETWSLNLTGIPK